MIIYCPSGAGLSLVLDGLAIFDSGLVWPMLVDFAERTIWALDRDQQRGSYALCVVEPFLMRLHLAGDRAVLSLTRHVGRGR
jgi:hypothetical protein